MMSLVRDAITCTSLVFSKILYCSTVWSNTSTHNIDKSHVQSIQNFASKIVMNSRKFDHVTPLLRQLNWLPVKQLLYFRDAVLTYKCFNGLAPKYLLNATASIPATTVIAIYFIYHLIELLPANAHLHIEKLVFGTI